MLCKVFEVVLASCFAGSLDASWLCVLLNSLTFALVVAIQVISNVFVVFLVLQEYAVCLVVAVVHDRLGVLDKLILNGFREPVQVIDSLVILRDLEAKTAGLQVASTLALSDNCHFNLAIKVPFEISQR